MKELMSYLPEWYGESRETKTIEEAIQPEWDGLRSGRDSLLEQLDPRSATWGLRYWEDALGLTVDEEKAEEQRRNLILGKLQGRATTTPALIRSVAERVLEVAVEVGEIFSEDRVEIRFDAPNRLPSGMDDLKVLLDQIMPAHLAWDYLIRLTPGLYAGGHFTAYTVTRLPLLNGG